VLSNVSKLKGHSYTEKLGESKTNWPYFKAADKEEGTYMFIHLI